MIEVIYKEEKQEAQGNEEFFRIPKNIRQIGFIPETCKIYVEDYVYTFLTKLAEENRNEEELQGKLALLTGKVNWSSGITYIFIRSALKLENTEATPEHIVFTEGMWTEIHEQLDKYFPNEEIVGWFFTAPGIGMEMTDTLYRTHRNHFGGNDKVLFLMEPGEKEETFFRYENGQMSKQSGYYVYYEQNPSMQAYMIDKNQNTPSENQDNVEDRAVKDFRKIIREKKGKNDSKRISVAAYAASACLAVAVLAVGSNFLNDYNKMQDAAYKVSQVSAEEKVQTVQSNQVTNTDAQQEETAGEEKTQKEIQEEEPLDLKNLDQAEELNQQTDREEQAQLQEDKEQKEEKSQEESSEEESRETGTQAETKESYVIRPGDTLYKICMQKYNNMDEIEEICRLNGLKIDEIIYPGQVIVLP